MRHDASFAKFVHHAAYQTIDHPGGAADQIDLGEFRRRQRHDLAQIGTPAIDREMGTGVRCA